jgi:hypothetical protein
MSLTFSSINTSSIKPKDLSTAILAKKKAPNKLTVQDSKNDDNTIIELTEKKMEELKLMRGDQVLLRGMISSKYNYL